MPKCPKCGSSKTRKSQFHDSKKASSRTFTAWFRCHECRNRFNGTNWALVGLWATPVVIFVGAIVVVFWASFGGVTPHPETQIFSPSSSASSSMNIPEGKLTLSTDALIAAAEDGDSDAQYRLGATLFREYQEQENRASFDAGLRWLTKAAGQDHAHAQFQLGKIFETGRGVIQDYTTAIKWFQQAAEQGEARAMFRLGRMYEVGRGVPKDLVEAYVWLNLAGARGEARAEAPREHVRRLILDKLTDAQSRSRTLDLEIPRLE